LTSISDLDIGGRNLYVVGDTLSSDDACDYEISWYSHHPFRSCSPDKEKGIFYIWPLIVTLTLEVGTYIWQATHHLVMMHVSIKFH